MPDKPVYWVSDVHLGAVPPETEEAFRRWLQHVRESGSHLVISGDLFDFWFEYRHVVLARHVRVLALLADLVASGVPVTMLGGNHDWWAGDFLRRDIGLDYRGGPLRAEFQGRSTLVVHGDGLGSGDTPYKALRAMLRTPVTRWLFRWLHPDLGIGLVHRISGTRAHRAAKSQGASSGRAAHLLAWAKDQLESDPTLEMVVAGHVHEPSVIEIAPARFYVNTGDWVKRRSYVTTKAGEPPILHEWGG